MSLFDKQNECTTVNIGDDGTSLDELIRIYLLDDYNYNSKDRSSMYQNEAENFSSKQTNYEDDEQFPSIVSFVQQHHQFCPASDDEHKISDTPRPVSPISCVTDSSSSAFEIRYEDDNDTIVSDLTSDSEYATYYDSLSISFVHLYQRPCPKVQSSLSTIEAKIQETSTKLKKRLLRSDETRQMIKRQRLSKSYLCDSNSQRNIALTEFSRKQLLQIL